MLEEVLRQIAASGILGAILVVLGLEYRKQGAALAEVQQARVDDAKKVVETLLALQDRWQETVSDLSDAVQRLPPDNKPPPRRLP